MLYYFNIFFIFIGSRQKAIQGHYILRFIIAGVFIFSGLSKYYYFGDFYLFVSKYFNFLPLKSFLVNLINVGEIFIGGCLLTKTWNKEITIISLFTTFIFLFVSFYLLLFTDSATCMCFGNNVLSDVKFAIPKNIILLFLIFKLYKQLASEKVTAKTYSFIVLILMTTTLVFSKLYVDSDSNYLGKYNVESISIPQTLSLIQSDSLLFIDSRLNTDKTESIVGSINLPYVYRNHKRNDTLYHYKNKNYILITFCDGNICTLAKKHANFLKKHLSYNKVYYLQGGMEAWQKHNKF